MCVVLIVPKDVRPSLETLRLCEQSNPHGGGIAWRKAGAVEWLKTNDVAEIYKLARTMKGELVIHFRIASVGGVCSELRHPFPVSRKCKLLDRGRTGAVLFQNGTWGGYDEALRFAESEGHRIPPGEMSDARAAAFLVSIYGHKFLAKCGHSLWVYFSGTETIRYGDWFKRDGIYFSNLYWLPPVPTKRPETHPTSSNGCYCNKAEQFELPGTIEEPAECRELYDLRNIEDYWKTLHEHNRLLREKAKTHRTCPCCDGTGRVLRNIGRVQCPLCKGERMIPRIPRDVQPTNAEGEVVAVEYF